MFSIGNSSGLVVGQIFTAQEAPRYAGGTRITLGFTGLGMALVIVNMLALHWVNKKREQRLAVREPEQSTLGGDEKRVVCDYDDTFKYNL